jgi:hypothetical protein
VVALGHQVSIRQRVVLKDDLLLDTENAQQERCEDSGTLFFGGAVIYEWEMILVEFGKDVRVFRSKLEGKGRTGFFHHLLELLGGRMALGELLEGSISTFAVVGTDGQRDPVCAGARYPFFRCSLVLLIGAEIAYHAHAELTQVGEVRRHEVGENSSAVNEPPSDKATVSGFIAADVAEVRRATISRVCGLSSYKPDCNIISSGNSTGSAQAQPDSAAVENPGQQSRSRRKANAGAHHER